MLTVKKEQKFAIVASISGYDLLSTNPDWMESLDIYLLNFNSVEETARIYDLWSSIYGIPRDEEEERSQYLRKIDELMTLGDRRRQKFYEQKDPSNYYRLSCLPRSEVIDQILLLHKYNGEIDFFNRNNGEHLYPYALYPDRKKKETVSKAFLCEQDQLRSASIDMSVISHFEGEYDTEVFSVFKLFGVSYEDSPGVLIDSSISMIRRNSPDLGHDIEQVKYFDGKGNVLQPETLKFSFKD